MNSLTDQIAPSRDCPVCNEAQTQATTWQQANVDWDKISSSSFASRKRPEFMTWGYDLCRTCDCVFASSIPTAQFIEAGYENTDFISSDDATDAACTYEALLSPIVARLAERKLAIDVGCGPGPFLPALQRMGFEQVIGVEPSKEAVKNADPAVSDLIELDFFSQELFDQGSADLICLFQTIEHLPEPKKFFEASYSILKPGGILAIVCHNRKSRLNKMLGSKSPIIDIEHLQLFDPYSLRFLSEQSGFESTSVNPFVNQYSLSYMISLMPLPSVVVGFMRRLTEAMRLNSLKLPLPVGNLLVIAKK